MLKFPSIKLKFANPETIQGFLLPKNIFFGKIDFMKSFSEKKKNALELLKFHYGFDSFRRGQEEVIDNVLQGKSTVVIMPTGGGKSLCYQLPALVLEGVTIVISPLISLMKDQVDALNQIGIAATFVNSSISQKEASARLMGAKNELYKILYVAPERFYDKEFVVGLLQMKIALFAVDEAHCISQWGHDFRPSYTRLNKAIEILGYPPVLALTATATPEVKEDIIHQLNLKNPEIVVTGFSRPNLQFGVVQASEGQKPQLVLEAINSSPDGSGIIYIGTRSRADNLLHFLLENDIEAASYHAGMDVDDRKWVQDNFMNGKIKVIVATNAFGLGIDKSDTRFVIHYDMPGTIEAYYQEAGRAGRDGKPSFCLLLYNSRDRHLHEFFIKGDNPSVTVIYKIYETLLSYESDSVLITYGELAEMISENIPEMAIGTSLKILEKEGLISRSNERQGNAFIKLLNNFSEIKKIFSARSKKQLEILEKIYDKYKDDLIEGIEINLNSLSEMLDVKKDAITRLIKKISDNNLLEYRPPFKGTEIRILKRIDLSSINIDTVAMKEKLKRAYGKLDKMDDYILSSNCRQKYILQYFGEKDAQRCGKCDICLSGSGYHRQSEKKDNLRTDFDVKIENKTSLNTKLTQLETLEYYNKGYDLEKIAKIRDLDLKTIKEHVEFLKNKGIIK